MNTLYYKTNTPHRVKVYACVVFVLATFFFFYKNALEVSPSVIANQLMSEFHLDGAQLGNLTAFYYYAYFLMQIPAGILVDRFGPRRLTSLAILVCALGGLILAHSHYLVFAQTGRFITGFGAAFAAVSCLKLIATWFKPERFALMAGLMMTVAMLGAVFGEGPLAAAVAKWTWRPTLSAIAVIGFVYAVLFWLIVRDENKYMPVSLEKEKGSVLKGLVHVLKQPQCWLLAVYSGLSFSPVTMFGGLWGINYLSEAYKISKTDAGFHVSLIFIGFAVGCPIAGWLSDVLGKRKKIAFVGTLVALLSVLAALYMPGLSLNVVSVLFFVFGMSISCFLLCFTMIREINPFIYAATAIGFMNAFDAILGAVSDPFVGKLLDLGWHGKMVNGARIFSVHSYKLALLTIPVYLLLALVVLYFVKETISHRTDN
ncbi:MAG: MFS transporter [Pseudomonadota bacterium]